MSGKVGLSRVKSGDFFSSGPCCRYAFASVFSFRESIPGSGRFSTMLIHCSNRRQTHAGLLAVGGSASGLEGSCRFMSGQVGGRSGQSGQFSYFFLFWTLTPAFVHVSSLSLLRNRLTGSRASLGSQGLSCAFRFPTSGSHGISMTIRSQR